MSKKNRDKKTPMFVSNMVTNYDFVDYTEPGQSSQSTFGNPSSNLPTTTNSLFNQPAPTSPKKAQNNWFDQMLQNQEQKNVSSPKNVLNVQTEESKSPRAQTFQTNYNFSSNQNSGFSYGQTNQSFEKKEVAPNFVKQKQFGFVKKQAPFQKPQPNLVGSLQGNYNNQGFSNFNKPHEAIYSSSSMNQQQKFSKKPEISYQTTVQTTKQTNFSSTSTSGGYSFPQPYKAEKQKYNSPPHSSVPVPAPSVSSSSTSSNGGFSDQSLVNSLPQPARSNILAMIRRSKGLAN